ncbi:unnamed protein product, partial [Brassica rapa subsp. trilocularis]
DRKSRHRRIKKQHPNELLAATSQIKRAFTLLFHTRFMFSLSSS